MRSTVLVCAALACACATFAKEPKAYQKGKIVEIDPIECGTAEKYGQSFAGEMSGTDNVSKKTHEAPCREYLLEAEHVIYRIRPRNEKHAVLLIIGQKAQFRIQKDKLLLRIEDIGDKEHEYIVISMSLRIEGDTGAAAPTHVSHIQ
jgi:hypothetical protein